MVDLFKAQKDAKTGVILKSGNIEKVANSIKYFEKKSIDTLYISGIHKRSGNDPYAIESRLSIEESIGGEEQFKELLVDGLHEKNMKIIVDLFDRVGSQNMKLKNRHLLTSHLTLNNILVTAHGAEGKSNFSYSNTTLPNYRKKCAWDILIDEAVQFVEEFQVDGLHLDN